MSKLNIGTHSSIINALVNQKRYHLWLVNTLLRHEKSNVTSVKKYWSMMLDGLPLKLWAFIGRSLVIYEMYHLMSENVFTIFNSDRNFGKTCLTL